MSEFYAGRKVEVRVQNGAPVLYIDGEQCPYTGYKATEIPIPGWIPDAVQNEFTPLIQGGLRICWVPVFVYSSGPGQYDFTEMDSFLQQFADAIEKTGKTKEVSLGIRIQAASFTPEWYLNKSFKDGKYTGAFRFRTVSGELGVPERGPQKNGMWYSTIHGRFDSTFTVSLGDEFWDTVALDLIRAAVNHARTQPYYKYVFAWLPTALTTNEWYFRTHHPFACSDLSEPTQKAFAKWLRARGIEAGNTPVPTPEECYKDMTAGTLSNTGSIRMNSRQTVLDPAVETERRMELYSQYMNERVAEIVEKFMHTVKECTADAPKLAGTFYGYTIEVAYLHHLAQSGHLEIHRLLQCKDLDFICSPALYSARNENSPVCFTTALGAFMDSAALYGKLVFSEDDHSRFRESAPCAECRDDWHDEQFFYRNFAMVTAHRQYEWWYSLGRQWLAPEYRQKIALMLNQKTRELAAMDSSQVSEVAILMDEASVSAMRLDPAMAGHLLRGTLGELAACGVPYDIFDARSFLEKGDHQRYKFIIFANQVLADEKTLAQVNALKNSGRTLMFFYNAGYRTPEKLSEENAFALTGIKLQISEYQPVAIWCDPDRNDWIDGEDLRYGIPDCNTILLKSVDAEAEALGWLFCGNVGFVRKKFADWTSVWSAAPEVPALALRKLIAEAGVKMYAPLQTAVFANASFFSVSAGKRGNVKLSVPDCRVLKDLISGEEIAPDAEIFMKRHETRMFIRVK